LYKIEIRYSFIKIDCFSVNTGYTVSNQIKSNQIKFI
jgi:hypothetical protein